MKKRYWNAILLLAPCLLWSDDASLIALEEPIDTAEEKAEGFPEFWSTGPLIIPPTDVIDVGHFNYQPYLFWYQYRGVYDKHWNFHHEPLFTTVSFQPQFRAGVFSSTEFDFIPIINYNNTEHEAQWVFGDIPIALGSILLEDDTDLWYHPSIKLQISANLPTGKYQKLKAKKLGTDIGGIGSWAPGIGLILYHEAHIYRSHYFTASGFIGYQFQTPVRVKGLNAYGGDAHTRGKVYPGDLFQAILSFEYSLSHRWILAMDTVYNHFNKTRFKGHTDTENTLPSSEQISLAPGIEYMWTENFGINGGVWFTVGGRNTDQFTSGVISIYINK